MSRSHVVTEFFTVWFTYCINERSLSRIVPCLCPSFKQNRTISRNFSVTFRHCFRCHENPFSRFYICDIGKDRRTDRHGKANARTLYNFRCECTRHRHTQIHPDILESVITSYFETLLYATDTSTSTCFPAAPRVARKNRIATLCM